MQLEIPSADKFNAWSYLLALKKLLSSALNNTRNNFQRTLEDEFGNTLIKRERTQVVDLAYAVVEGL